jgi:putative nucleotidyltransferase with HDIG domain
MNSNKSFNVELIFILLLVVLIPILVIGAISINHNINYVKETVTKNNMELAQSLKGEINANIDNTEALLKILSDHAMIKAMTPNEPMDDLLTKAVENHPLIAQIYIMDTDGSQIYKTSGKLGDRSDRDYFQQAVKGKVYYSDVLISRSQDFPIIVLAMPIIESEEIKGVIGASLDLFFLDRLINNTKPGEGGASYLVDRRGSIIAHSDNEPVDTRENVSNLAPVAEVINGKQGTTEYTFAGAKQLVSFTPIAKRNWGILVQLPSQEAFARIEREKLFFLIVILITALLASGLAYKVTAPITRIAEKMSSFSIGDKINFKEEKINIEEIEKIKTSFVTLAEEVNASYEQLEAYSQQVTAMNEELSEAIKKTKKFNDRFDQMVELISNLVIADHQGEETFLSNLLQTAVEILPKADYGTVYIYREGEVRFVDCIGYDLAALQKLKTTAEDFYNQKKAIEVIKAEEGSMLKEDFVKTIKPIKEIITFDLAVKGEKKAGVSLDIAADSGESFSRESKELFAAFHNLATSFFKLAEYNKLQGEFTKELISSMVKLLEVYDKYTSGHSESVAKLAVRIAKEMDLEKTQIDSVYWAGMVHDIGKLLVPLGILNKPDRLTEEEYAIIKNHPQWGYEALKKSKALKHIAKYVLYHHEKWDGSGYPEGFEGEEIPLLSQILGIADAWDAMTSNRAYRVALNKEKAIQEIKENKGVQFAPEVVEAFLQLKEKQPPSN